MTALAEQENRRTQARVNAGFSGKIATSFRDESYSIRALVIDISATGARVIVNRDALPMNAEWKMRQICEFEVVFGGKKLPCGSLELQWIQRERDQFDVLGFRFLKIPEESADALKEYIHGRLNQGETIDSPTEMQTSTKPVPLETELKASAQLFESDGELAPENIRCFVTHMAQDVLVLESYKDEAGDFTPLTVGARMLLTVHPPSWSGLSFRSLSLEVIIDKHLKKRSYLARHEHSGNEVVDAFQMLQYLVPPKRSNIELHRTVNVKLMLLALAVFIALLFVFSMR